jgi:hypothetical protein
MDNDRKTIRILALTVIFCHGRGMLIITVFVKIQGKLLLFLSRSRATCGFCQDVEVPGDAGVATPWVPAPGGTPL